MNRKSFLVVILFIIVAVLVFFIAREIEDFIFLRFAPEDDIIRQLNYSVYLRLMVYGFYILLLIALSLGGFLVSKRKSAIEYKKGFLLVSAISGILLLAYLIVVLVVIFR